MITKVNTPFKDPFLASRSNPLFAAAFNPYWDTLTQSNISQMDQAQADKALENLLRFAFSHLFKWIYKNHPPHVEGSAYFISTISADGLGDYFALLKSVRVLKKNQPHLDIHAVYTYLLDLPEIHPQAYHLSPENIHSFHQSNDPSTHYIEAVLEGNRKAPNEESESLYNKLKDAGAIIHIALAMNTFDNPDFAAKSFYFAEAGNFQGIANYLQRQWFSLGLHPFEEGIFLKPSPKNSKWEDWRLDLYKPEQYENLRHIHAAYLPKIPEQQLQFLYFLSLIHKDSPKDIDVFVPESFNLNDLDHLHLAKNNISSLQTIDLETQKKESLQLGHLKKKTLRIIRTLPVPSGDFARLVHLSDEIVGCTGDLSLSECLAAGKIPFYELRKHKQTMIEEIKQIALALNLQDIHDYFQAFDNAEKLYTIYSRPTFTEQWNAFHKFLKKHCSFEDSLAAHLNRHFWMISKPKLKELEINLIHQFLHGAKDGKEVFGALENELK